VGSDVSPMTRTPLSISEQVGEGRHGVRFDFVAADDGDRPLGPRRRAERHGKSDIDYIVLDCALRRPSVRDQKEFQVIYLLNSEKWAPSSKILIGVNRHYVRPGENMQVRVSPSKEIDHAHERSEPAKIGRPRIHEPLRAVVRGLGESGQLSGKTLGWSIAML
jgi:hypothetical protein